MKRLDSEDIFVKDFLESVVFFFGLLALLACGVYVLYAFFSAWTIVIMKLL